MAQYQSISIKFPKMHGNGPKGLAMVINRPHGPTRPVKFKSFKEAMTYLKKKEEDSDEDEG